MIDAESVVCALLLTLGAAGLWIVGWCFVSASNEQRKRWKKNGWLK